MRVKKIILLLICVTVFSTQTIKAKEAQPEKCIPPAKYPDYSTMYLGEDKFEGINRKIFLFNSGLNKYILRPANILWASVMPLYGMDRIKGIYTNIQYPKRLVSTIIQKDFKATRDETLRFLANSTIGLGGMFDPAKSCFKINPTDEDLEQALCKCKIKQGPYIVVPGFTGATTRDLASKVLECPLDPSLYVASPITAIAKASMILNKTTYMQPLSKMLESTFADPYDITKKLYGIEKYIKTKNYDRTDLKESYEKIAVTEENTNAELAQNADGAASIAKIEDTNNSSFLLNIEPEEREEVLKADVELSEYNPQCPLTDAMRTILFNVENVNKSAWSEMSLWNRSFDKQVKNANISLFEDREKYPYRYILQKEKNSPIAILYPSFAENSNAHHNLMFAKILYDEGYSVIFQGNPFHWSFAKSMPQEYHPGLPKQDAQYLRLVSKKILDTLEKKYECKFGEKILIGTSMGAVDALFVGNLEKEDPQIHFSKIIAVSPPVELVFALKQIDKFSDEWSKNIATTQENAAQSASKILKMKNNPESVAKDKLPFSEDEARLITCFYMRQKLSDLIFAIENIPVSKKTDFYQKFNNMNFRDYSEKYMLSSDQTSLEDLNFDTSLYSIAEYLASADNYKIYHSLDDYYVNTSQLQKLRELSREKAVYLDRGSHLGFLYRDEFLNMLKNDITLKQFTSSTDSNPQS